MASFEQLKELFLNQEEKDGKRREKEKEEEEKKRKENKEEVKQLIKSRMSMIKEDITEIKMKQDLSEDKVKEAEHKMAKKYEDMANKLGELNKKIQELEVRKNAEKEESDKTFPALQPAGRTCSSPQPPQPVLHPRGRKQACSQPVVDSSALQPDKEDVYSMVKQARKTVRFSPISNSEESTANISTCNRFTVLSDSSDIPQLDGFLSDTDESIDTEEGEEEEGELRGRGGRRVRARGQPRRGGRGVRPGSARGRGGRGRRQEVLRGRPRGRDRGRGLAREEGEQQIVEGGQQAGMERGHQDAHGMEVETGRVEVGRQLPAHGMENENIEVGRGVEDAQGMEDRNEMVEGAPQLPAHGMELQERVAGAEDKEEEGGEDAVEQAEAAGVEAVTQFLLTGRARPDLPPPTPGAGEEEGWQAIHRLGGTEAQRPEDTAPCC